ncbi:glycosyltransferase family 1 protein [candidate division KSB1 bacterium]|nr:glycosyltransferase family 4 protein [candidate division KSB1 bacterium]RQW07180.1 MAG: glycosyltransferase family 1 protein [candidate division KSB1 bacterium]
MKIIGINSLLLSPKLGGVGVYLRHLLSALENQEVSFDYRVFVGKSVKKDYPDNPYYVTVPITQTNPLRRVLHESLAWPHILQRNRIALFHSPFSYISPGVTIPSIVTIHDLRYVHAPDSYRLLRRHFLERAIPKTVSNAYKIIAVSDYTKQDILRTFNLSQDRVVVIHEGIDHERFNLSDQDAASVVQRFDLKSEYILALGHLEPRKNYIRLLQAYKILVQKHALKHHLVIVGQENWHYREIYRTVKKLGLQQQVKFLGFVAQEFIPALYKKAHAVVAPSLFEGFGFVPLEAMAAGVPAIVSKATSHPEVCGEAAVYFDPMDPRDMAEKIALVLEDSMLRNTMISKGYINILRFSWRHCWEKTFDLYEDCLNQL